MGIIRSSFLVDEKGRGPSRLGIGVKPEETVPKAKEALEQATGRKPGRGSARR